ncbi:MAG: hypothetical protein Q7K45_06865, partial [Nanoarchaeota archaeon]|nr:hypothetical protein [Nanoarchaeota archaeon]
MATLTEKVRSGIASLLSLALGCAPVVYAQRNYDQFPDHKADLALYNMRQIATQICDPHPFFQRYPYCKQMTISTEGIQYIAGDCKEFKIYQHKGGIDKSCEQEFDQQNFLPWKSITKVLPGPKKVKVC